MISKHFTSIKLLSAAFCLSTTLNANPTHCLELTQEANKLYYRAINLVSIDLQQYNKMEYNEIMSQSIEKFIQAFEELKEDVRQCWQYGIGEPDDIDPENRPIKFSELCNERFKFGQYFHNKSINNDFHRNEAPFSPILLGCWAEGKLMSQSKDWIGGGYPYPKGFNEETILHEDKNNKNVFFTREQIQSVTENLISTFKGVIGKTQTLEGIAAWIQNNFCIPISKLLMRVFETVPSTGKIFIQILELYKCYIECDAGIKYQLKFAQFNYDKVNDIFYRIWIPNIRKTSGEAKKTLILIASNCFLEVRPEYSHWNESFFNKRFFTYEIPSLRDIPFRHLEGYQIEISRFAQIMQDEQKPNPNYAQDMSRKEYRLILERQPFSDVSKALVAKAESHVQDTRKELRRAQEPKIPSLVPERGDTPELVSFRNTRTQ